jgi:hypothetical protein
VSIHYPFRNFLFLYGACAKGEVMNYVRTLCVPEEQDCLPQILSDWINASKHFQQVEQSEKGEPQKIDVKDVPAEFASKLDEITNDYLFKQAFSLLPFEFKFVEVDKLVAGQRSVNLDYAEALKTQIPANPTIPDLIDFCLSPQKQVKVPAEQMLAQNVYSFTSENTDFRFLGGFRKPLTEEDIKASTAGGYPLAAIVLLVGLGASSMNVLAFRNRHVLNNGFHRAYALRSVGVTHIPVVVQRVSNPQLEFPPVIADLPREYLLGAERPALMKDFSSPYLTRKLKVKAQNKIVQVQWNASQFTIPIVG